MTVQLAPSPVSKFFDNNGNPLFGGQLFTYQAGTLIPQATYVDSTQTTQNTNPIILNSRGEANIWLVAGQSYKFTLQDASGNNIWTVDNIVSQFLFQQLNPQTPGEIATGITPTNYQYPAQPFADVRRYGWLATNTDVQNQTALATAVTALNGLGGTIIIPPGTYALAAGTILGAGVIVRGSGKRATFLTWNSSGGTLFQLGGTASNYYGCGLSDLTVQLTGTTGIIVLMQQTVGAEVSRLYLEGETISAGRSTQGVVIDGASASAAGFFNSVMDVECNHIHLGFYEYTSTGTTQPTQNRYTSCQGTGDVATDTTSIGVQIGNGIGTTGVGQVSVFEACDFEGYNQGFLASSTAGPTVHIGSRFEGNTTDLVFNSGSQSNIFLGCAFTTFTDANGDFRNQFIAQNTGGAIDAINRLGPTKIGANVAGDINLTLIEAGSQTGDVIQVQNSALNPVGDISPSMQIYRATSLSGSTAKANNLRGTATFSSATTVAVSFGTAEPDASYFISLGGNAAGFCWVTAKGTGGFTINCSASNSNAVDWHLIR